jgi:hypothetical protein
MTKKSSTTGRLCNQQYFSKTLGLFSDSFCSTRAARKRGKLSAIGIEHIFIDQLELLSIT